MQTPVDMAMDAQFVRRWNLVSTTSESTVASHSFNVAILSMAIMNRMRTPPGVSKESMCMHAILHDIDEVYTGDMPTPTKEAIRKMGVEPNEVFVGQGNERPVPQSAKKILVIADLMDNYLFIKNHGVGIRAEKASEEVGARFKRALSESSDDLREAAEYVFNYVLNRRSEESEERKCIEEARERRRQIDGFKFGGDIMGGESLHQRRDT